jgi:hypothetical protein
MKVEDIGGLILIEDDINRKRIFHKKFIYEIKSYAKDQIVVVLCYPGMRNDEIKFDGSIDQFWEAYKKNYDETQKQS